jgi:hypothetical protein
MWEFGLDDLIQREWYLMLPFVLIAYRKKFMCKNGVEENKNEFMQEFRRIMDTVGQLSVNGKISSYLEGVLYGATKNIAAYFNDKFIKDDAFGKEVKTAMVGTFRTVRTVLDDVRDEGIEKGIEKGMEKGMEKGIEKGRAEDARKMLRKGYDPNDIFEITGISFDRLQELEADLLS